MLEFGENTCRICLSDGDGNEEDLNKVKIGESTAFDILNSFSPVKLVFSELVTSNLPHKICPACTAAMKVSMNFWYTVWNSQKEIDEFLAETRRETKEIFDHLSDTSDENDSGVHDLTAEDKQAIIESFIDLSDLEEEEDISDLNHESKEFAYEPVKQEPVEESDTSDNLDIPQANLETKAHISIIPKQEFEYAVPNRDARCKGRASRQSHICRYCLRTFRCRNYLVAHVKSHTKKLLNLCVLCDKGFYFSWQLKNHMMRHQIVGNSYKCKTCARTFLSRKQLEKHCKTREHLKQVELDQRMFFKCKEERVKVSPLSHEYF